MPRTKISKVARALNIGLQTAVDFLEKKGISVDTNPNTKIDENAVVLLVKEYNPSADAKAFTAEIMAVPTAKTPERPAGHSAQAAPVASKSSTVQPAVAPAAPASSNPAVQTVGGVRILGHIELDRKGNPVRKPAPKPAPKPEVKPEPQPEVKPEPKAEVKPEPQPEVKAEPKQEPRPEVKAAPEAESKPEVKHEPKVEAKPENKPAVKPEPKPEVKPEPKPEIKPEPKVEVKPEAKPASPNAGSRQEVKAAMKNEPRITPKAEEKSAAPAPTGEPEVFTLPNAPERPQLNIVGKIDLDALNQSTRPKKKPAPGQRGAAGQGDRKKRKRINGKEKVDIEKTSQQTASENREGRGGNQGGRGEKGGRGGNQNQGGRGGNQGGRGEKSRAPKRQAPPQHTEVNEEDVQKQVKETLARLTQKDKGQKKGVKWRKEKREAFASREREAMEAEEAESQRPGRDDGCSGKQCYRHLHEHRCDGFHQPASRCRNHKYRGR